MGMGGLEAITEKIFLKSGVGGGLTNNPTY